MNYSNTSTVNSRLFFLKFPHAWENSAFPKIILYGEENTPTCVGKTLVVLSSFDIPREHSHVCGKNSSCFQRNLMIQEWFVQKFVTFLIKIQP